jgi:hypothetical protein
LLLTSLPKILAAENPRCRKSRTANASTWKRPRMVRECHPDSGSHHLETAVSGHRIWNNRLKPFLFPLLSLFGENSGKAFLKFPSLLRRHRWRRLD